MKYVLLMEASVWQRALSLPSGCLLLLQLLNYSVLKRTLLVESKPILFPLKFPLSVSNSILGRIIVFFIFCGVVHVLHYCAPSMGKCHLLFHTLNPLSALVSVLVCHVQLLACTHMSLALFESQICHHQQFMQAGKPKEMVQGIQSAALTSSYVLREQEGNYEPRGA